MMVRTKNQQESDNSTSNNNPLPQTGNEVAAHYENPATRIAAEDNRHEEGSSEASH